VQYSEHARNRLRQRGITKGEVKEALNNVTIEYPSKDHSNCRVKVGTTKSGRSIKVVIDPSDNTVVTVIA
jgi:hypothetical protein